MKLYSALLGLAALALSASVLAQEPIVIRFSHVVAPNTPKGSAAEKFKQLAEALTKGKVKVEIYPASRLYGDLNEFEALQRGWVEMLAPSLSKFRTLGVPEFEVFDLPYIIPDKATLYRVMDGDIGRKLFSKLEAKGVLGLAYWDNGFKQMSANRPLRRVEDFKGLKMRIQHSKVLDAQMKALGAFPQPIAFAEAYAALRQGVVGGTENPLSNFYTQKMHEVQKHLTLSDHGYLGYAVVVKKKFWEGLPQDVRGALEQAMREATKFERDIAQKDNDDALAAVRKAGTTEIHTLTPEQQQALRKALFPVHKKFEGVIGRDLLQAVYKVVASADQREPVSK
jgi:C4-dicarboxylate-binding protein DctP